MLTFIIILILTTLSISIPIFETFMKKENIHDLLFLVLTNGIFIISTTLFAFQFKEIILSICSSFFLLGYSAFLILLLKKENKQFHILELPYFLFTLSLFLYFLINFLI